MTAVLPPAVTTLCADCLRAVHAPGGLATAAETPAGCRVFADLDEHANIRHHTAATRTGPTVGDSNSHVDEFRDGSGRSLGTATGDGWKLHLRPDGHVMSYYREELVLDGGTVQTSGWMDSTAVWAGQWQTLHAVGTGGDLAGLVGVRQIRQVRPRELFTANVVLCAAPARC